MVHTGALRGAGSSRTQPRSTLPADLRESARRHRVSIVHAGEHQVPQQETGPVDRLNADAPRVLPRQLRAVQRRRRQIGNGSRLAREQVTLERGERRSHSQLSLREAIGTLPVRKTINAIDSRNSLRQSRLNPAVSRVAKLKGAACEKVSDTKMWIIYFMDAITFLLFTYFRKEIMRNTFFVTLYIYFIKRCIKYCLLNQRLRENNKILIQL